jgi:hypothetical protein
MELQRRHPPERREPEQDRHHHRRSDEHRDQHVQVDPPELVHRFWP